MAINTRINTRTAPAAPRGFLVLNPLAVSPALRRRSMPRLVRVI